MNLQTFAQWSQQQLDRIEQAMHRMGQVTLLEPGVEPVLHVVTVGRPQVQGPHGPLVFPYQKVLELLLYLVFHPGATREALQEALFPDHSPSSVYSAVRNLRQLLQQHFPQVPQGVQKHGKHYQLSPGLQVKVDVLEDDPSCLAALCWTTWLEGLEADWVQERRQLQHLQLLCDLRKRLQNTTDPHRLLLGHLLVVLKDPYPPESLEQALLLARQLGETRLHQALTLLHEGLKAGLEEGPERQILHEAALQLKHRVGSP